MCGFQIEVLKPVKVFSFRSEAGSLNSQVVVIWLQSERGRQKTNIKREKERVRERERETDRHRQTQRKNENVSVSKRQRECV